MPVPRGPKVRQLLTLLALRPGNLVSHDTLVDELWGKEPPRTAISTIRTHIYHLRRALERGAGQGLPPDLLGTELRGYVLRLPPDAVDAERFWRLARQGEALCRSGRLAEGSELLSRALQLWRGDVLADVPYGVALAQHVRHLEESYIRALQERIEADMRLGQHARVTAELRTLVTRHPLNEWLHGQLITALTLAGRRGDALRAYQELREILREELGLEPSPALQNLQRTILTGTPQGFGQALGISSDLLLDASAHPGEQHLRRAS
ncbi:AfsR/SARP family transcriptional regulator [Allostreptomyces psammosilenae]|uniref:DNA-binding SARP family transcriptional activator n=1 Tax=Allostreptomyces psammosilenae TaxID=1892865 RepID=A0A853A0M3_9ACTN|nr:AfsR/SARP family transcriptional regulator [Allostreptomyces psammosilenae]NYI04062.1 DNA-binding SARP family transcriptional activator [Allostreptomyces psammosilenae]